MPKDKQNNSRITFTIDEKRYLAFKLLALSQDKTIESILNQMIQKYLDDDDLEYDKKTFQKCFNETDNDAPIPWDEFKNSLDWNAPWRQNQFRLNLSYIDQPLFCQDVQDKKDLYEDLT